MTLEQLTRYSLIKQHTDIDLSGVSFAGKCKDELRRIEAAVEAYTPGKRSTNPALEKMILRRHVLHGESIGTIAKCLCTGELVVKNYIGKIERALKKQNATPKEGGASRWATYNHIDT